MTVTANDTADCEVIITYMNSSALIETNSKVNGRAHFLLPPSQTHEPVLISLQIITRSAKGVDMQNLVGIDSAVTIICMHEKSRFHVDFYDNICIHLSVFCQGYRSQFWVDFNT